MRRCPFGSASAHACHPSLCILWPKRENVQAPKALSYKSRSLISHGTKGYLLQVQLDSALSPTSETKGKEATLLHGRVTCQTAQSCLLIDRSDCCVPDTIVTDFPGEQLSDLSLQYKFSGEMQILLSVTEWRLWRNKVGASSAMRDIPIVLSGASGEACPDRKPASEGMGVEKELDKFEPSRQEVAKVDTWVPLLLLQGGLGGLRRVVSRQGLQCAMHSLLAPRPPGRARKRNLPEKHGRWLVAMQLYLGSPPLDRKGRADDCFRLWLDEIRFTERGLSSSHEASEKKERRQRPREEKARKRMWSRNDNKVRPATVNGNPCSNAPPPRCRQQQRAL